MLPPSLPSDITQARLAKAFRKAGFVIDWEGGDGSHCKAVCPKTKKFITIQHKIFKHVLKEKLKQAELLGYDAGEIMRYY